MMRCTACNASCADGAKFCAECGAPVAGPGPKPTPPSDSLDSARRHLTVMFVDLIGSTAMSDVLDPEDVQSILQAYHRACAEAIGRLGGHVAQYLGDGVLAYFGYPHAQEDAAHRAVRAGLDILTAVRELAVSEFGHLERLQTRIGLHTGVVVVNEGSNGPETALAYGDVPNIAARIQAVAAPDSIAMSEATRRMIRGQFELRSLGEHALKGIATPLEIYRVLAQKQGRDSTPRFRIESLPLIGREEDMARIESCWQTATQGSGRSVLVTGEPGVGKSRLLAAVLDTVASTEAVIVRLYCSSYHQNSPFHPVVTELRRQLGFQADDDIATLQRKLDRGLQDFRSRRPTTVSLLADLLSIPRPPDAPELTWTPENQKRFTLWTLADWLVESSGEQPVYLQIEDLQWCDPSTLELIDMVLARCAGNRLLVLMASRERADDPGWDSLPGFQTIDIGRFDREESTRLIHGITGNRSLPAAVTDEIIQKADGVPLFVEELTRYVLESGWLRQRDDHYEQVAPLPDRFIPDTLQDSLMARFDHLPGARGVVQVAATLGREFLRELIAAVWLLDEPTLHDGLETLVDAELLQRLGAGLDTSYVFSHALIRDAAYDSILRRKREQLHQWAARVIETSFPGIVASQPEIVAEHFRAGGQPLDALPYWLRAGKRAARQSAYVEALRHFERALEATEHIAEPDARNAKELEIRTAQGVPLIRSRGYASSRVQANYLRARELCVAIGDAPQRFPTLKGLFSYHMLSNDREPCREILDHLERLATSSSQTCDVLTMRGMIAYWSGDFAESIEALRQAAEIYSPTVDPELGRFVDNEQVLLAYLYPAWALVEIGRFDEAVETIEIARALIGPTPQPYLEAVVGNFDMMTRMLLWDVAGTSGASQAIIELSELHGYPFFAAAALCAHGTSRIHSNDVEAGIDEIMRGLDMFAATGTTLPRAGWLSRVIDATLAAGRLDEAAAFVDEALELRSHGLNRSDLGDVLRAKGQLLAAQGADPSEAIAQFEAALDITRRQGAVAQEIRAATAMLALVIEHGEDREDGDARAALQSALDKVTPGELEVPFVTRARRLLDGAGD